MALPDIADDKTLETLEILAAAFDEPPLRGNLALRSVARALRRAMAYREQEQLAFAADAFDQLDGPMRRQVAAQAFAQARSIAKSRGAVQVTLRQATSLLQALNSGGRKQ